MSVTGRHLPQGGRVPFASASNMPLARLTPSLKDGLPNSVEAEFAVLGAMMLGDRRAVNLAASILEPNHFYREIHGVIFREMIAINRSGELDIITLQTALTKSGHLPNVISLEYLLQITDIEFTTSNIEHYANIVLEMARLRQVIHSCFDVSNKAIKANVDADEVIKGFVEAALLVHRGTDARSRSATSQSVVTETAKWLTQRTQDGINAGIPALDQLTTGMHPAEVVVVGGLPGTGKTALMSHWLTSAAKEKKKILTVTAEMPYRQLCARMAYSIAKVDGNIVRSDSFYALPIEERERVRNALKEIADMPITWMDNRGDMINFASIEATARELKMNEGLDAIFVDYLQIIGPPGGNHQDQRSEIEALTRGFARLATNLDVAIMTLSQYSRNGELKGSGSIDADACTIIKLTTEQEATETTPYAIINADVVKQRNGITGNVNIAFNKTYGRFANIVKYS